MFQRSLKIKVRCCPKDITLELEEAGSPATPLGASGSGKSTILNIIAGLLDATTGDVYHDGNGSMMSLPTNGMMSVFQSYALFPTLATVRGFSPLRLKKVDQ